MNKILFTAVVAALLVSGCSDKDDTASGKAGTSALEKAMESSKGTLGDIKDKASEAVEGAGSMASGVADAVGDKADNAMEGASAMVADAKTAVSESASSAMESASDAATKAVAAVGGAADGGAAGQQVYKNSCQSCHAAVSPARPNWVTRMPGRRVLLRVLTPW